MLIIIIRLLHLLWRFRWLIAITLAFVAATKFMPSEAARQAWATVNRFSWLLLACFCLYAGAQFFAWRKELERSRAKRD